MLAHANRQTKYGLSSNWIRRDVSVSWRMRSHAPTRQFCSRGRSGASRPPARLFALARSWAGEARGKNPRLRSLTRLAALTCGGMAGGGGMAGSSGATIWAVRPAAPLGPGGRALPELNHARRKSNHCALYGECGLCARLLDMFRSEVDRSVFPDATQKSRFECIVPIG